MNTILYTSLGLIIVFLLGIILWFFRRFSQENSPNDNHIDKLHEENKSLISENSGLKTKHEQNISELSQRKTELDQVHKERNELNGNKSSLVRERDKLEIELKNIRRENEQYKEAISKFRAEKKQQEDLFHQRLEEVNKNREKFEEEKIRIQREDEVAQKKILDEKNRKWNDHENEALYALKDICKKPELNFSFFDNNNLPTEFDGKLKPDFMISFLDQYIIFDAKKSLKPEGIKNYIADQVKKSAEKFEKNGRINSQVFFIVPQEALESLNKISFFERGFRFFIISKEAIEPILFNFKRITEYENIEQIDPQERENIVDLFANYDRHISFQNAANIVLARESIELMNSKNKLGGNIQDEISIKKQSIREKKLLPTELKKISSKLENQQEEIEKLTSSNPQISQKDLNNAQEGLF